MKRKLSLTETDLHRMVKECVKNILKEATNEKSYDDFTMAMNKLFNIARGEIGEDSIRETIGAYFFDFDNWDNESNIVPCRYSRSGMFSLLHLLVNYDIVCVNNKTVNVKNSNRPNVAKLIKPFVDTEMCSRIYEEFRYF